MLLIAPFSTALFGLGCAESGPTLDLSAPWIDFRAYRTSIDPVVGLQCYDPPNASEVLTIGNSGAEDVEFTLTIRHESITLDFDTGTPHALPPGASMGIPISASTSMAYDMAFDLEASIPGGRSLYAVRVLSDTDLDLDGDGFYFHLGCTPREPGVRYDCDDMHATRNPDTAGFEDNDCDGIPDA